jgi:hypothetical protein
MSLDSPLLIGVVLIVIGAAFGLLAYGMMTSRRSAAGRTGDRQPEDAEPTADQAETAAGAAPAPPPEAAAPPPTVLFSSSQTTPPPAAAVPAPPPAAAAPPPTVLISPSSAAKPPSPSAPASPTPPSVPAGRVQIAQLLRDEVSGELIVQVGAYEYRSAAELKSSKDWTRIEYAARDLDKWLANDQAAPPSAPTLQAERKPASGQAQEEPTIEPTLLRPRSMIEEINEILGQHASEAGLSDKGIKLVSGPGGSVRVMIGLNTYDLSEVPDERVSELIRQAVAAWEGRK